MPFNQAAEEKPGYSFSPGVRAEEMKGLDLKEPFQKAAVTVSAPGQQTHSLHPTDDARDWQTPCVCACCGLLCGDPTSLALSPAPRVNKS